MTSHLRPDGDSLCTALALAMMGRLLGKDVAIINQDPTPLPFSGFPELAGVRVGQIERRISTRSSCSSAPTSPAPARRGLDGAFKINIDHHYSNTPYADINWIDPEAAGRRRDGLRALSRLARGPP